MKVVVAGLSPLISLGITTALLRSAQPYEIEHAEQRETALELARRGGVDLFIIDPYRPTLGDGLDFCQQLKRLSPAVYLLAFCDFRTKHDFTFCYLAGIDSFVSSQERPERLVSAVGATLKGRHEWIFGTPGDRRDAEVGGLAELTPRELEVLWMVSERYTNEQIGGFLSISQYTVKNHVAAILRKLGVKRRSELYSSADPRHH
ncbi:response regulator transcription factor [Streptosporangiaceae bacterium NEAU-GS5]|nr:response regulator transcription factor [Streptosporangiaceae bacterium NEAU-GS5]